MKRFKTIIATMLAAATMISTMPTSAYAIENEQAELIDINGHLCYERDGMYFTSMNGIEYLVIEISHDNCVESEEVTTYFNSTNNIASLQSSSIGAPANWTNSNTVSLPNGSPAYQMTANLTSSDYCTPVFEVTPTNGEYTIKINNGGLVAYNSYRANVYYHLQDEIDTWHCESNVLIPFSLLMQYHLLITGTSTEITDGFAIKFLKASSTGQPIFNFSVEPTYVS